MLFKVLQSTHANTNYRRNAGPLADSSMYNGSVCVCVWLSGKSNKTIHSLEIIESSASVGLLPLGVVYSHLNCKRTMWISITNFLFEASDKSSQWGMNNSEGAGGPEANRCAFHHNYDTPELVLVLVLVLFLFLFLFVVPFLAVTKCKSWNYMCIYLST